MRGPWRHFSLHLARTRGGAQLLAALSLLLLAAAVPGVGLVLGGFVGFTLGAIARGFVAALQWWGFLL